MKEKRIIFPLIPLFTCAFLPFLSLVLYPFGYSVSLASHEIFSAVSAVICIISAFRIKESDYNKSTRFFIAFLPLIQLINTVVYVDKSKSAITAVFMAVCFIACAVISKKVVVSNKSKIASVLTSSLLFLLVLISSFIIVFASWFAVNNVVKTVESPDGTYYAEIIDCDEGALGGSTIVYVKESDCLNLLILKIEKTPERVYLGEWGEYETMEIEWADNSTLLIDSTEYNVNT